MSGCNAEHVATPESNPEAIHQTKVSEEEYHQIEQRILGRIVDLKTAHASLHNMASPYGHEHNVKWALDNPATPHSKVNARRAVFEEDGYWFSLKFYRGQWQGAAFFHPIEFGDLKLWYNYGHGGNTSVIVAVTNIVREENEMFCKKHRWQRPNQALRATGKPAP